MSGLFFYDIFWVFGTDKLLTGDSVMVTVAKSLDAPIKLLFPKTLAAEKLEFSILGLGDIVIPGILVCSSCACVFCAFVLPDGPDTLHTSRTSLRHATSII